MKKYIAEFIGTFAIVFCGTGSIIVNQETGGAITHVGIAITFGLIVLVMIYAFGNLSGAHFNPAVSIAFSIARSFPLRKLIPYIASQVVAGIAASFLLHFLFPANSSLGGTIPSGGSMQSFILEAVLTFFLMTVIFHVSKGSKETGIMAGIAIGATVLLEAMFAGPVSGASMNPARSIGPAVVSGNINFLWLYIIAPISGAVLAALLFCFMNQDTQRD